MFNGERTIVAGGRGELKTESCSIRNGIINCIEQAPSLYYYGAYPEMFLVDDAFYKDIWVYRTIPLLK